MIEFHQFCSYSAIIPAILAIIFFRRAHSKLFNILIILALINDFLLSEVFNGVNNWLAIFCFILAELFCMGFTMANLMPTRDLRKVFRIVMGVIFSAELVLFMINWRLEMIYIQNASLIIISAVYLYQFLKQEHSGNIWTMSLFWIGLTIFFNYFANTLSLVLIEPMMNDTSQQAGDTYVFLTGIINLITYAFYSIALVLK